MLKKQLIQYIENNKDTDLVLCKEELEYAKRHDLIATSVVPVDVGEEERFKEIYMERCDKETDNFLGEESEAFLNQSINYLQNHMNEYLYVEFGALEFIGVDGVTLEVDDIFRKYNAMVGLKLQKKYEPQIKAYLNETLQGEQLKFALQFSQKDGLWDLNILLSGIEEFHEDMTIGQTLQSLYQYLFALNVSVEEGK